MPYLWIWLLVAPPLLALIDFMTSSANTAFGRRDTVVPRDHRDRDGFADRAAPLT